MKLSIALLVLTTAPFLLADPVHSRRKMKYDKSSSKSKSKPNKRKLPEIFGLIAQVFNFWDVDDDGNRLETKPCTVSSCEWNPYYLTKRYDGDHPDFGGHPTDLDVQYAFYKGSPFLGQAFAGSPLHCNINAGPEVQPPDCPKIKTLEDNGPNGAGFIPPHIALAALTWAIEDGSYKVEQIFNYDFYGCRVVPDTLLKMIRSYYPRETGKIVDYPPPFTPEGGDFKYEFPSGNGIDDQNDPYTPGPPHWCTPEYLATGNWPDFCPYIFKGENAGKYRHPHIAYAALEVFLAAERYPNKCADTWLENNPDFIDDDKRISTILHFPAMSNEDAGKETVENWLAQPILPYDYTKPAPKSAGGDYVNSVVLA